MNPDTYAELVPVSEWVWNLYDVKFWDAAGVLVKRARLVTSATEHHIESECNDVSPVSCASFTWELLQEGVRAPQAVGKMYGQTMSETGWAAGARHTRLYGDRT